MILYNVYKNLGNKNKPNWSESPISSGKSDAVTVKELLSEFGDTIVDYNLFVNEATLVMACDAIVIESMEIEGE